MRIPANKSNHCEWGEKTSFGFQSLYSSFQHQKTEELMSTKSSGKENMCQVRLPSRYNGTNRCLYSSQETFFIFFKFYLFIFGCAGSSLLHVGFLQLWRVGSALHCSARASPCSGFFCCRAWTLDVWAQQLWHSGSVAP